MHHKLPQIIQGGMGVGISSVELSRAVSMQGQLGVVSGTALAVTLARRLQESDCNQDIIDAVKAFPYQEMSDKVLDTYLYTNINQVGKDKYKAVPMPSLDQSDQLTELMVVANFVEVYLAKKNHAGIIGLNLLEKITLPTLPSLYGAMLAGVDYVLMGAGIPIRIPYVLDQFAKNEEASLPIKVNDETQDEITYVSFSPIEFAKGQKMPLLKRPKFLAIVSSHTLALHLSRSDFGSPDGFVVELPVAGGHNASPRGKYPLNDLGEPIYGVRDEVDFEAIKNIGLPFWLAGGFGSHEDYVKARNLGATGIQVGTAFAFSKESGMEKSLKERIIQAVLKGLGRVKTDPLASPTGFPFKVVEIDSTNGIEETYLSRNRICDLGYLREAYRKDNGKLGYRCPSEPIDDYVKKGGKIEDTVGRKCLCNGLVATLGFGQERKNGDKELPIVTAGDDLKYLARFIQKGKKLYEALDVIKTILGPSFKPAV
ncbi:MAG: nitronate monooxygenase [Acholeplasmataceae bacterium]|jgi:NAD(P)H-dependent flavin oxidoreductase YrpB (nitropropane dioxygenase family)|nr:nitronate monooxygenase [Acholeplasmataceae bacterium]